MRALRPVIASEDAARVARNALPEDMLDVSALGAEEHVLLARRLERPRIAGD